MPFVSYLHIIFPSISKTIAMVKGLRDLRLRSDAAKLRTSVSGTTSFRLVLFFFLALLFLVSSIFSP